MSIEHTIGWLNKQKIKGLEMYKKFNIFTFLLCIFTFCIFIKQNYTFFLHLFNILKMTLPRLFFVTILNINIWSKYYVVD